MVDMLIVGSDEEKLKKMQSWLGQCTITARNAYRCQKNIKVAIETIKRGNFDLILASFEMLDEEKTGLDILISAEKKYGKSKTILLAEKDYEVVIEATKKPISFIYFQEKIEPYILHWSSSFEDVEEKIKSIMNG